MNKKIKDIIWAKKIKEGCKYCKPVKNKDYNGHFWRYKKGHPCSNCGRDWCEIDKEIYAFKLLKQ